MRRSVLVLVAGVLLAAACASETPEAGDGSPSPASDGDTGELTIYSGRGEELVGPVIDLFEEQTGITANVRYGDTAELAATILEEGDRSPADVFFAQDAGALGAVAREGRFAELPSDVLERVPQQFRSSEGLWVGTSGRARVVVYNTENVDPDDLPASILDYTDDRWEGRVGWAPTNGSFQAAVTAMRLVEGEEATRDWLTGIRENDAQVYASNTPIVQAVARGEIDVGFVNHYYAFELGEEDTQVRENAENHYFRNGDVGGLVNAAGVGILDSADNADEARAFVEFLLSREGDEYFSEETFEYPLVPGVERDPRLPPLDELEQPDVDLSDLEDLEGTLELLQETGVL